MSQIDHGTAIRLEHIVRRAFNHCDRFDLSGLANSDHFDNRPLDAALMVISAIYATGRTENQQKFSDFLYESECTFEVDEPEEEAIERYVDTLSDIVSRYF